MNALKADYQAEEMAQALEVSPSGYYAHQHKPERPRARRNQGFYQSASALALCPHVF